VGVSPFDPTGQGHRGKAAISAFWDNVIVRNPGRFRIRQSHPCADECANVITTTRTLPNGVSFDLDFVVVYRVDGAGKIISLRAYWQYDAMVAQVKALLAK
jgi:ketosteroid isomerase-like protein